MPPACPEESHAGRLDAPPGPFPKMPPACPEEPHVGSLDAPRGPFPKMPPACPEERHVGSLAWAFLSTPQDASCLPGGVSRWCVYEFDRVRVRRTTLRLRVPRLCSLTDSLS